MAYTDGNGGNLNWTPWSSVVNPDKLIIPRDQALEKRRMADYKLVVHAVDAYLTGKDTASYDPDTWFKDED